MIATLRKCLRFLASRERWRWAALIPLAIGAAVLEAIGASVVFLLIKIIGDPAQAGTLPVGAALYRWLPRHDPQTIIVALTVGVALFYIFKNVYLVAVNACQTAVASHSTVQLSTRMLERYLAAPVTFHFARNSAELIRNSTTAVDAIFLQVMVPALNLLVESLIVAGILVVLALAAPLMSLAAAGFLFAILAVLLRQSRELLIRWGRREQELRKQLLQNLQQSLGALKEVRLRGRERVFSGLFTQQQQGLARLRNLTGALATASRLLIETVFVVGMLAVIVLITVRGRAGQQIVPVLGLYAYAGFRVIPSINRIVLYLNTIRYGAAAVDHLYEDFEALPPLPAADADEAAVLPFNDRIAIEHVSYSYNGRPPALHDVSFTIRRGESIGIVGPTGAGKSTLLDVLLGLLSPSAGSVRVDGIDIATARRAWQRKIGYVPQSVYLLDDSLLHNIGLGLLEHEIDVERARAAARWAQLDGFISRLPQGLRTTVGEGGACISGGERQRVAIARALYHDPELLVLDEATASLDPQTERELTRDIEALHGRKTLIIIAHRMSTVRSCDRLVFLRDGRVAGIGSFDELCATNPEFRQLATASERREPPA